MRKRLTRDEIKNLLKGAGFDPEYFPSEKEVVPYAAWFLSNTDIRSSDDGRYLIAEDTLRVYLCDADYNPEAEMRLILALMGVCASMSITRLYNADERLHVAEFIVKLIGKI